MNFTAITRRIRLCESEVPAQLVLEHAIKKAVEAEREACAKTCEKHAADAWDHEGGALNCANNIRARSNAKGE